MRLKRLLRSLLGVDEENKVLKARVTCQENRLTDLGAYAVAAVKEMRQHTKHKQAPAEEKHDRSKCCGQRSPPMTVAPELRSKG